MLVPILDTTSEAKGTFAFGALAFGLHASFTVLSKLDMTVVDAAKDVWEIDALEVLST